VGIENHSFIVDFHMKKLHKSGGFPVAMLNYQRVRMFCNGIDYILIIYYHPKEHA